MLTDAPYWPPIHLVCALAGRGEKVIDDYQRWVDQARAMLASGTLKKEDVTAFMWELEESPVSNQPQRIWAAYVDSYATGAGLTITLYVALARSEAAMRQMLSSLLSRDEAEAAIIARGLDPLEELVPGASALVSDSLKKRLLGLENGEDEAASFTFLAQTHSNSS